MAYEVTLSQQEVPPHSLQPTQCNVRRETKKNERKKATAAWGSNKGNLEMVVVLLCAYLKNEFWIIMTMNLNSSSFLVSDGPHVLSKKLTSQLGYIVNVVCCGLGEIRTYFFSFWGGETRSQSCNRLDIEEVILQHSYVSRGYSTQTTNIDAINAEVLAPHITLGHQQPCYWPRTIDRGQRFNSLTPRSFEQNSR